MQHALNQLSDLLERQLSKLQGSQTVGEGSTPPSAGGETDSGTYKHAAALSQTDFQSFATDEDLCRNVLHLSTTVLLCVRLRINCSPF